MSGSTIRLASSDPNLPDSVFTWRFLATSGDQWGGTLIADSALFAPGDTLGGVQGVYTILTEDARGVDLTPSGLEDNSVRVEWYWDGSANGFLPTRLGADWPAGLAGLGSERDDAWTGTAWAPFGLAGALQANSEQRSLFYWNFVDRFSGDAYGGWTVDLVGVLAAGTVIPTARGQYTITGEAPAGAFGSQPTGTVWVSWFYEADSGRVLQTQHDQRGGGPAAGRGLGNEQDFAWDGDAWDAFGAGDTRGVVVEADRLYVWRFVSATTGDLYWGRVAADSPLYTTGARIEAGSGSYVIFGEVAIAPGVASPGAIWTDFFYDAGSNSWLTTQSKLFDTLAGTRGLGSEWDFAWDGDEWDRFGGAGATDVVVETVSLYVFFFRAFNTGDAWFGRLYADTRWFEPGWWASGERGYYEIYAKWPVGVRGPAPNNSVFVDAYFDGGSGRWAVPGSPQTGLPSGYAGLGSEFDAAWDGNSLRSFGYSGWIQADF